MIDTARDSACNIALLELREMVRTARPYGESHMYWWATEGRRNQHSWLL